MDSPLILNNNQIRRLAMLGVLSLWCAVAPAEHYTVPLLVPAGTSGEPQGVLRILNATDESGTVEIYAIDDAGTRSGPATLTLNASAAIELTATDLESGNAMLGFTGGIGTDVGDARLEIETDLQIVPLAFVRAADGTLSAMHDTVRAVSAEVSGQYRYEIPVFNLSTEMTQVSRLRLINPGDTAAAVTIGALDDSGAAATGGDVTLTLAPGAARTLNAQQLEAGDSATDSTEEPTVADGSCYVGLLLEAGGSCTYPGTSDAFTVTGDGRGRFLFFNSGGTINLSNSNINGRIYDFSASHQGGGVWRIDRVEGGTGASDGENTEAGGSGMGNGALTGRLGAGTGKWRLTVSSDQPLEVVNIVASSAGYWNNLSTTAVPGAAPAGHASATDRFDGLSIVYETDSGSFTHTPMGNDRFTETGESDGVTTTYMGDYSYSAIGPDAGRLTLDYDDGDQCQANLYFSARTSGWFASHCTASDDPDGYWIGGTWSLEDDDAGDGGGMLMETTYGVDDALPGVPTSGVFVPSVLSGGSVSATGSGTTVTLNNGGYFELSDGARYTCTATGGCTIVNGTVTAGAVTGRAAGSGDVDRFPSFRTAVNPGDRTYTTGTAIDALMLPEASGGNGDLTYSLSPSVPGLTFNTATRQLTGTPSTAGTNAMTYTVTDEDGDTDTLSFTITVSAGTSAEGSLGECQVGMTLSSGQSCTYPGTTDEFSVNARGRGSFLGRLAGIRVRFNNETINDRVYDFEASHQGDGVWRIDRIAGSTEVPTGGDSNGNGGTVTDTSPSFAADAGPGMQTYTAGTAIDALTLPTASGGDGTLSYSLSPDVPGLTFNATARQLSGTPSTAASYNMTYTVTDEDGDSDTLSFTIAVEETDGSGGGQTTSFGAGDTLTDLPTGFRTPDTTSAGGSISFSGGNATIVLDNGGYIEKDNYRYTCQSAEGCTIRNRDVVSGTIVQTSAAQPQTDTDPVIPPSPTNVRYVRDGSTTVVIWDAVQGADYYKVYHDDVFNSSCRLSGGRPSFCEELAGRVVGSHFIHPSPSNRANYYWVVACNSGGCSQIDSANPAAFDPDLDVELPYLDVESLSVSASIFTPGQTFTLSATVRNRGSSSSAATTLRYYRSSDRTISTSDTEVGAASVGALAVDGAVSRTITLPVPSTIGIYYYGACIESVSTVSGESATQNNCSAGVSVAVRERGPDLVVESPSVSDTTSLSDGSFVFSATVLNRGSSSSTATTLRYYRSSDGTISTSDTEVGTASVGALAVDETVSETMTLPAPSSAGTYYYGACIESVSGESDSGNNCSEGVRVTVREPAPDLVVESPSVSDTTPAADGSFMFTATVRNRGTGASTATTLRYYRSDNRAISTADMQVGTDAVSALAIDGASTHSISLPAPTDAGTYYYGACVDEVAEESSTRNNCSSAVPVFGGGPFPAYDLTISSATIHPPNFVPIGTAIPMSVTVTNRGPNRSQPAKLRFGSVSHQDIPALDSGATTTIRSTIGHVSRGRTTYRACIVEAPGEGNTSNNCVSRTVNYL